MGMFKKDRTPIRVGILFSKNVPQKKKKKYAWYRAL